MYDFIFTRNINPPPSSLLITRQSSTNHYGQHLSHLITHTSYEYSTISSPDDPFALCALLALGPTLAAPTRPADAPLETRPDAPPIVLTVPREPAFEEPALLLLLELGDGLGLGGLAAHKPPPLPQPAPVDALN